MMSVRDVLAALRVSSGALLLAASLLVAPVSHAPALAAPAESRAAPLTGGYLDQLLREINGRRALAGSPPLAYATPRANEAVGQYLADLTPHLLAMHSCSHGTHNPVPPGWDYVAAAGLNGEARGEVIGCPMDGFHWTPQHVASSWWESPAHFAYLYGDPEANVVACGAYGPGGRGFTAVACVTYRV